jgi:hypothetical protein
LDYVTHSVVSNPGRFAHLFEDLPRDLAGISRVAQGLIYHYVADQYTYGYCPPTERLGEVDTRYLEAMLGRLIEMDRRPLTEPRAFENRLVGCCRDFALVACAILRHQGTPARLRFGFAGYFFPGYWVDHVIVETWDGTRWRRFDPEIPATKPPGFDVLDMPEGQFESGGRAWQMYHDESVDPARFGLGPNVPEVSGEWVIRGRLLLDCAALGKQELLCWDEWSYGQAQGVELSAEDERLLDQVAALSLQPDAATLRAACAGDGRLRVPETVTCWSPAVGPHAVKIGEGRR